MVRFLLEAGADQEHKTDEMHTALMEASMDGHVEVARLLLDSGAQVNMPTDSFESPLTLAACGGHVDLAMLLIERGANIEEVNDEGYTPLMEAAREGHEEMVSLLLTQNANINAQTEETQETALTLACCGGFLEVADYLIKHGADIELGASTPLMEAAQEGHLDLVKFLLENKADVHAQTQTGDTALTYACENGHTDVAEVLLYYGAELEHLSEGGRTPLMKACRAGHVCTVKFLIQKGADVNRQTTNNDHTPLSLACAGGHQQVVELLLAHGPQGADPFHKLKDNSTMLIEAAKGGHTGVVQLLLDYPTSISTQQQNQPIYIPAPMTHQQPQINISQMKQQQQLKLLQQQQQQQQHLLAQQAQHLMVAPPGLHDVTEGVIRLTEPPGMFQGCQPEMIPNQTFIIDPNTQTPTESSILTQMKLLQSAGFKDGLAYGLTKAQSAVNQMVNQQPPNNISVATCGNQPIIPNNLGMTTSANKQKNIARKKTASGTLIAEYQATLNNEIRSSGVGEEENVTYVKSSLEKVNNIYSIKNNS
jgi:ankyrin repeat domain-containing protein 17